jgi:hypothetical protein
MKRLIYTLLLIVLFSACSKKEIKPISKTIQLLTNGSSKAWLRVAATIDGEPANYCEIINKGTTTLFSDLRYEIYAPECYPKGKVASIFKVNQAEDSLNLLGINRKVVELTDTKLVLRHKKEYTDASGNLKMGEFVNEYRKQE